MDEAKQVEQEAIRAFRNPARSKEVKDHFQHLYPELHESHTNWLEIAVGLMLTLGFIVGFLFLFFLSSVEAQVIKPAVIDMAAIAQIESSGNPMAWNKRDDSRGTFQITPICLTDWNNYHPKDQHTMDDLWDVSVNRKVADWYMHVRIPALLRHFKKQETVANKIVAWNAGISYVAYDTPLPPITRRYIQKYKELTK